MDRSRFGDQYFTESDRANAQISDSRAFVGICRKDEKAKSEAFGIAQSVQRKY